MLGNRRHLCKLHISHGSLNNYMSKHCPLLNLTTNDSKSITETPANQIPRTFPITSDFNTLKRSMPWCTSVVSPTTEGVSAGF